MDRLRVLVIDDSLTIRAMLEELVEREQGCRVVGVTSNASEARSMLTDLIPNVVTLDLNMPGTDGMTFLDGLRGKAHPPIVVVSSATPAGSPQAEEAMKRGAYACFDKARLLADAGTFIHLLRSAAKSGTANADPQVDGH